MERLRYSEAREWFWVRTAVWFVPAALGSTMAHFAYTGDLIERLSDRVIASAGGGICSVLIAILTAYISLQLPWMHGGLRISYVLNGPVCALIAGIIAVLASGIILTFLQANPPNAVEHRAAYEAFLDAVDRAYQVMVFASCASAFWGFIFGSWFAMRRDKYFIDSIMY